MSTRPDGEAVTAVDHDVLVDLVAGAILGLAIGDALGYPHEFRSVAQVRREIGPDGITGFLRLKDPRLQNPDGLGESWVAEEAVASALYCVWRHPDHFRACVLEAVNTDGDSDSIACIAGGIVGARLGLSRLPADLVADVERSALLHDLAARLVAARRLGPCR